jgi:peptidyl-prolyl cis-trans isomerase A (cyclophilin A)
MHIIRIIFLLIIGVSCSTNNEKNVTEEPVETVEKIVTPESEKLVWLTDENCVSFLSDYGKKNKEIRVLINTPYGEIVFELFDNTPLHRANMIYLIKEKQYFDGTYFYRVVKNFIAQAGNKDDERTQEKRFLIGKYAIPAEMKPEHYHKTGAVAMARSYVDNPDKNSSSFDFFIITGQKQSDFGLDMTEKEYDLKFTEKQRTEYMTIGGAPHLDGELTVMGKVVKGLDVAIKISNQKTDGSDWPIENIPITMTLL